MTNFGDFRLTVFGQFNPTLTILEDMDFEVHENAYEDMIFYTDMSEYSKKLPEQQRVILQGILTGKDDKEIATELNVSRQYVNRIKKKMLSGENIF